MTLREQIAQQALSLEPEDRLYVADLLEQSLTTGDFAAKNAAAWSAEIDRRMEAYDSGETPGSDVEISVDRIGQELANHRARKVAP